MAYLRGFLSAVAALSLAVLVPLWILSLRVPNSSGLVATDLAGLGFRYWLLCGILAVVFFPLFFAASRFSSTVLRIFLFWTPVTILSTLGFGYFALLVYGWLYISKG
jgi:hypothetical protein